MHFKNEDSVFFLFHFITIFPDPYFLIHAAVGKSAFYGVSMFFLF